MQKSNFSQLVSEIVAKDGRYDIKAYTFVREGLDYTLKTLKRNHGSSHKHVSGGELLEGLRQHTINEYGPMGKLVLNEWGINACEDFGQIVFNLVNTGILGKSDHDRPEDFVPGFSFDDAFVKPFLPKPKDSLTKSRKGPRSPRKPRVSPPKKTSSKSNPAE